MITIEGQLPAGVNRESLNEIFFTTLQKLDRDQASSVGLSFMSKKEMAALAQEYAGKTGPTDVLSFESENPKSDDLGDVIICTDIAQEQADAHAKTLIDEVSLLFAHGLLHLLGFDHAELRARDKMEKLQREILSQNNIPTRRYL